MAVEIRNLTINCDIAPDGRPGNVDDERLALVVAYWATPLRRVHRFPRAMFAQQIDHFRRRANSHAAQRRDPSSGTSGKRPRDLTRHER